jgi:hypothetical protein
MFARRVVYLSLMVAAALPASAEPTQAVGAPPSTVKNPPTASMQAVHPAPAYSLGIEGGVEDIVDLNLRGRPYGGLTLTAWTGSPWVLDVTASYGPRRLNVFGGARYRTEVLGFLGFSAGVKLGGVSNSEQLMMKLAVSPQLGLDIALGPLVVGGFVAYDWVPGLETPLRLGTQVSFWFH